MSRVFIVHGWGSSPGKDWIPWIGNLCKSKNYDTKVLNMPDADNPKIESWVKALSDSVGEVLPSDCFIGHSIGCQTILRYLEGTPQNVKVDKVILVAPWYKLTNLENDEAWNIAHPWLNTPLDHDKILRKANQMICLFSDNDSWVPLAENQKYFHEKYKSQNFVLHHRGHFTEDEGILKIPELEKYL